MLSRCTLLPLLLSLALVAGCSSASRRSYYLPLGEAVSAQATASSDSSAGRYSVRATCQGSYLNHVEGAPRRSVHLQLELTRPSSSALELPLESLDLQRLGDRGWVPVPLAEVWAGDRKVLGTYVVDPWAVRSLDLFFDEAADVGEAGHVVRLRFRVRDALGSTALDISFARVDPDDPGGPHDRLPSDKAFGYRDGWYLPGAGDLGARALLPKQGVRSHYVFHAL